MHSAGTPLAGRPGDDGYGERAETYLRLLAETALRAAPDGNTGRVRDAAEILVDAGVLSAQTAAAIIADLQLALRVRGKREALAAGAVLRRLTTFRPGRPPAAGGGQQEPWQVLPLAPPPAAGSRLMALIRIADRALAPAVLHFSPIVLLGGELAPLTTLTATDDAGTGYRLGFPGGTWAGSTWTGTIALHPAPPATARKLVISGPNGPLLHADITPARPATAPAMVPEAVTDSPGERLLTRRAEEMLAALARLGTPGRDPGAPGLSELTAILEAAGLLSPLSPAPARLAALGQLLGLPADGPASDVPARWTAVVAYYGRRRRPPPVSGTAAIGVVLPALDGARFAVAGVHSGVPGSRIYVVAEGLRPLPRRLSRDPTGRSRETPVSIDAGFSWWVRDDAGGWHLCAIEDVNPVGREGMLTMSLLPPLGHPPAMLTLEVSGPSQRVTATLPVHW